MNLEKFIWQEDDITVELTKKDILKKLSDEAKKLENKIKEK